MPETQTGQPQHNEAVAAHDQIMTRVYNPVFFNKLAAASIVPRNEHEAQQLLYLGSSLYGKHQDALVAEAEKRGSFLDFAVARYDAHCGVQAGSFSDNQVKQAATAIVADAGVLASAVTLARALSQPAA